MADHVYTGKALAVFCDHVRVEDDRPAAPLKGGGAMGLSAVEEKARIPYANRLAVRQQEVPSRKRATDDDQGDAHGAIVPVHMGHRVDVHLRAGEGKT